MKPVLQSLLNHKYIITFPTLALLALLLFTFNNIYKYGSLESRCSSQLLPSQTEADLIVLLWTLPFGNHFPLNQCPKPFNNPRCFFTNDRSWYLKANAVIFHHRDVCSSRSQMPRIPRPEGQYWVWFNLESPRHSPNLDFMDNLINLTMSYRSDSDIFTPYGWLQKKDVSQNFTIPEKSKLVAWTISNWEPTSKRVEFYKELKNHISVEIYGQEHKHLSMDKLNAVLSSYKFYLSFENSIHTDYITEKLWMNALQSGTVPVVLGPPRKIYEKFIPSDSFIHVDDFPTAKDLANYLLELDKQPLKYEQYFRWRSRLQPVGDAKWNIHYCKACLALHKAPSYRTIPSLSKWYT
ncbi:3-galactosyl-N-acetylglucosaminide 4-alpha-L-fucosyltransferase FUT3-like isoform X2 [Bufo bufo]|nr:3-galactosyl-N-acetylglucosaminide 4-alpha-L-fucosyltransferase FUT3-like isoform X2 [Bufo bufo]XP_040266322.1 3-galactosyl-N-acetylglucosaminide 4-alpha-L-fucosyltransferase FUT3-like isoform X2 [Bufo bufo]XP_040266323.1 3-galactosyl-N-acetylglucosaminide 4-alpha-L-fucosyltransferase FUT3-like isoform X2 [Bufo bufo]XP_040266324.1 3-galactosyl-N-acetylglucosaminide 4-alpha-L-fucosyltransferase FUT3-like isoform X2 [Bufo bufo]